MFFWIHQDSGWPSFLPSFHPSFTFPGVAAGLAKVQAGAEIDHGPVTPLHLAARHGHLEACKASFFFSCSDGSIGRVEPVDGSKIRKKPVDMVVDPIILRVLLYTSQVVGLGISGCHQQYFEGEQQS